MAPAKITFTPDISQLGQCDLVLESIVEKRPAKQALYAQLRPILADHAILATNTSTIPITRLAAGMAGAERFCGLHFCHPVQARPLVEIIGGQSTSAETIASTVAHIRSLGKLPLVVGDGPGFVVNRLLMTYLNEALTMVTSGVPIQAVDDAMLEYGMPYGPLELLDEIGLDTALQSGIVLDELIGQRTAGSELLLRLVKAGQHGTKSGDGFYRYSGRSLHTGLSSQRRAEKELNPLIEGVVAKFLGDCTRSGQALSKPTLFAELLLRPMVEQAMLVLAERKLASTEQIDLAVLFGLGFPLWRGGLLWPRGISQ